MQREGLVQDVFTYGSLINASAKGYNVEKALQLLVEIQRKGLEPDVITFSALFRDCEKSDDGAEKALQMLLEIQRKGLVQDVLTYGAPFNAGAMLPFISCAVGCGLHERPGWARHLLHGRPTLAPALVAPQLLGLLAHPMVIIFGQVATQASH